MSKVYKADLIGIRESVVDEMLLLNPYQTPLLNLIGFGDPITNVLHEWIEDEMFASESTATAAKLATDTSITVASAEPFDVNQIIKVNDEMMKVTAVNGTTLTVVRGYAGTTAAAISSGDVVEVLFYEGVEGADARAARYKQRVRVQNKTQIFDHSIQVSGTALAMAQYGINTDVYDYERQKKVLEAALNLEKALINGILYENGQIRQMKGIRSFIQTNVTDGTGNDVTIDKLNDMIQSVYEKGGFNSGGNYVLMVPPTQKRKISALDTNVIRIDRSDNATGHVVERLVTDFGEFPIVINNNLDPREVIFTDLNRMQIRPLAGREFAHTFLGQQGDYQTGQIVGEYTLEFKQEKAHARIKNLAK